MQANTMGDRLVSSKLVFIYFLELYQLTIGPLSMQDQHFGDDTKAISIRQTRKGCLQEILLGCEARDEFKWFNTTDGANTQFATSLEDSNCFLRICCGGMQPFSMRVQEEGTQAEIMTLERPFKCAVGPCKCCCFQEMTMSSNGRTLGKIEEQMFCCVPRMVIKNENSVDIYKVHSPTCLGGMCVNCCAEGNPCCGKGCCKVPFHIFPADQQVTDNGAPYIGKILKLPKSMMTELFTDSEAFDITFPEKANAEEKALISGSTIFINANFFEQDGGGE